MSTFGNGRRPRGLMVLAAAGLMGASLAACEKAAPEPENEQTGAMMPDTSQAVPTPPDAGVTGVVPQEGPPPVQPDPPATQTGQAGQPVDQPDAQR